MTTGGLIGRVSVCAIVFGAATITAQPSPRQLRVISHIEVRGVSGSQAFGVPATAAGASDAVIVIGNGATRTESGHPEQGMLAGSILIRRDARQIMLNVPDRKFTIIPSPPNSSSSAVERRNVSFTRTAEFDTMGACEPNA
jgi:hypothetical protein